MQKGVEVSPLLMTGVTIWGISLQFWSWLFWFISSPLPEQTIEASTKAASSRHFVLKILPLGPAKGAEEDAASRRRGHCAVSCRPRSARVQGSL